MIFNLMISCSPAILAATIILSTFLLEDAAIAYAALLAASGMIAPPTAFAALFAGIYAGDLGLYFLGSAAHCSGRIRRLLGEERIAGAEAWLSRRVIGALVGARFVPGSRLPIYAVSGFLGVPLTTFALVTGVASFLWSLVVFTLVFVFGMHATALFGEAKYFVAGGVVALVVLGPLLGTRLAGYRLATGEQDV